MVKAQQFELSPDTFPRDSGDALFAYEGYPRALGNGSVIDLHVSMKDAKLIKDVKMTYAKVHLVSSLHLLNENKSSPVGEAPDVKVFAGLLVLPFNHPVTKAVFGIQARYWGYFRYRYPSCSFFSGRCEHSDILVVDKEEPVGIISPTLWAVTAKNAAQDEWRLKHGAD